MSRPLNEQETSDHPISGSRQHSRFFVSVPRPNVQVDMAGKTHTGKVRENNEDSYLLMRNRRSLDVLDSNLPTGFVIQEAHEDAFTMAVADGMGGAAFGELASALALRNGIELVLNAVKWSMKVNQREVCELEEKASAYFELIDQSLIDCSLSEPRMAGMGTTLTVVYTVGNFGFLAHAGDSRAYLFRSGRLRRMTRDHTLAQDMADLGAIAQDEVDTHRLKRVLTNYLGGPKSGVDPQVQHFQLLDQDRLLVCTDGLSDRMKDEEIAAILEKHPVPQLACDALISEALERGGRDNITVIVARYTITLVESCPIPSPAVP